jgi:hypothetical protein
LVNGLVAGSGGNLIGLVGSLILYPVFLLLQRIAYGTCGMERHPKSSETAILTAQHDMDGFLSPFNFLSFSIFTQPYPDSHIELFLFYATAPSVLM